MQRGEREHEAAREARRGADMAPAQARSVTLAGAPVAVHGGAMHGRDLRHDGRFHIVQWRAADPRVDGRLESPAHVPLLAATRLFFFCSRTDASATHA
jgi:hypothetical protein